jgi:hypothetical protein
MHKLADRNNHKALKLNLVCNFFTEESSDLKKCGFFGKVAKNYARNREKI